MNRTIRIKKFEHPSNLNKNMQLMKNQNITLRIPNRVNASVMAVSANTLPAQSWINAQMRYITNLNDYDFYTAMSYTVRSHEWIGSKNPKIPYEKGFIVPLYYQIKKVLLEKKFKRYLTWERRFLTEGYEFYKSHSGRNVPLWLLKEALKLYEKDLKRIISNAPPIPRITYVYRGIGSGYFKGEALKGFTSTSYSPLEEYGEYSYMRIKLLKGAKALLLQPLNIFKTSWGNKYEDFGEFEILLNIGSRFIVKNKNVERLVINTKNMKPKKKLVTDVVVF